MQEIYNIGMTYSIKINFYGRSRCGRAIKHITKWLFYLARYLWEGKPSHMYMTWVYKGQKVISARKKMYFFGFQYHNWTTHGVSLWVKKTASRATGMHYTRLNITEKSKIVQPQIEQYWQIWATYEAFRQISRPLR